MTPLIRRMTPALIPITILISLSHLVGAEHGPGDGFTGGIILSLGLTLQYLVFGYQSARHRFRQIPFTRLPAFGLAIALLAALLPVVTGEPLLAPQELRLELPLVGLVRLTRAMLFDLGVYFVVLGGTMTVIDSLERVIR